MTDQDVEAAYKSDFWSNLEDQWKSMDKEEHPWLDDFEQVCDSRTFNVFQSKKISQISKFIDDFNKNRIILDFLQYDIFLNGNSIDLFD